MGNNYVLMPDGELYHWGIKGMKWGVRRYQNKDGSLTPAGIKRYNSEVQKLKDREMSIRAREKAKKYQDKLDKKKSELDDREAALNGKTASKSKAKVSSQRKSIKDMSDDELRAVVSRLQLEQTYASLVPKHVSRGKKFVDFALGKVLIPAAEDAGKNAAKRILNDALNSALDKKKK